MSWPVSLGVTPWNQDNHPIWCQEEKALLSLLWLLWPLRDPELRAVCPGLLCPSSDVPISQFLLLMRVTKALSSVSALPSCFCRSCECSWQAGPASKPHGSPAAAPLKLQSEDRGLSYGNSAGKLAYVRAEQTESCCAVLGGGLWVSRPQSLSLNILSLSPP